MSGQLKAKTSLKVVCLGEVLWDIFPDRPRFGGAPANVACHAAALGAEAFLVSCVGNDSLGREAIKVLRSHGVRTEWVQVTSSWPTGTVAVSLDKEGKPAFKIEEDVAWDHLSWFEDLKGLAESCDAVCFGTLAQRSEETREVIQRFLKCSHSDLKVLDANLRPPFFDREVIRASLQLASVLKLSEEEVSIVGDAAGAGGSEEKILEALVKTYDLKCLAVTRGAKGATLLSDEERSDLPAFAVEVKDTVGAGDAFTAGLTLGLLRGESLGEINRKASQIASYVCSQSGAVPPLPQEIKNLFFS